MNNEQNCILCGVAGHVVAQCNWNQALELLRAARHSLDEEGYSVERIDAFLASQQGDQHPELAEGAQNERSAFEAWMTWWINHIYGHLPDFSVDEGAGNHYVDPGVSNAWSGWQARAALTAQPSPTPDLVKLDKQRGAAHPEQAEGAQGERAVLQSIMEWAAEENIPAERKLCLIRNAARAALTAQPSPEPVPEKELASYRNITVAMALDIAAVGEALGIPGEQQEGGTGEFVEAIEELKAERDTLAAQLAELRGQVPVAFVVDHYFRNDEHDQINVLLPIGTRLYAHPVAPVQQAVPEGWVLVPVKPTAEMVNAAWNEPEAGHANYVERVWAGALAAVPQPVAKGE
ncbi:hypothetical protein D3C81_1184690 [compost metagenome]